MDAYEVLLTLNDLEPVDLDCLEFGVITKGSEWRTSVMGVEHRPGEEHFWPFARGEVLVLDKETGREPFGEGRKPAKWDVECVRAETFAEAMKIRNAIPGLSETVDVP